MKSMRRIPSSTPSPFGRASTPRHRPRREGSSLVLRSASWNSSIARAFSVRMEARMGLAEYMIVAKGSGWSVLHDGDVSNDYATKEAAFESAVAAASLALREGHEVHVSVPGREAGNGTALGSRA